MQPGANTIAATPDQETIPNAAWAILFARGVLGLIFLMAGVYKISWHATAADDGHKSMGTLAFKVK